MSRPRVETTIGDLLRVVIPALTGSRTIAP